MDFIDHSQFNSPYLEMMQVSDPTPYDNRFTQNDIQQLSWKEKWAIYHIYDTQQKVAPNLNLSPMDRCLLFDEKPPLQYELQFSEWFQPELSQTEQNEYLEKAHELLDLMNKVAEQSSAYREMTKDSCWIAQNDSVDIYFSGNLKRDVKKKMQELAPKERTRFDKNFSMVSAYTLISGNAEAKQFPNIEPFEIFSLDIYVDYHRTKNNEAQLYSVLIHEIIGHAYLALMTDPTIVAEDIHENEILAFTRSLDFLKETQKYCQTHPELADFAESLEVQIEEETAKLQSWKY